ncbi:hypothetical protein MKFW12EY_43390 [Methylomonas koyamae]|nr:hypothetical protein MKFW12EY_43390 [Methylomonas koyamae]
MRIHQEARGGRQATQGRAERERTTANSPEGYKLCADFRRLFPSVEDYVVAVMKRMPAPMEANLTGPTPFYLKRQADPFRMHNKVKIMAAND